MLSVNGLTKMYQQHQAVRNVSFDLEYQQCVALLGPNGAGKRRHCKCFPVYWRLHQEASAFGEGIDKQAGNRIFASASCVFFFHG